MQGDPDNAATRPRGIEDFRMTHKKAMQILDRVREGVHYPDHIVTKALFMTGDIEFLP
jgi:hypothetical protein